jgi:hypothetical protein
MKNAQPSSGNVKRLARFHVDTRYQFDRARKILSELELFANRGLPPAKEKAAQLGRPPKC